MAQPAPPHVALVPLVTNLPATNIASYLDAPAAQDPDRRALIIGDEVVTYGDLQREVGRWAATLHGRGARQGDRVALVDWGGLRATAATLAAAHLGAATAQMNPLLTDGELALLAAEAQCVEGLTIEAGSSPLTAGELPERAPGGDRPALVLFTSGTTGLPKAVPISHDRVDLRVRAYRAPFDRERPAAVGLMCVPSFHVGGMLGLVLSLFSGDTTVVQPRFDAGAWLALAERHRVATSFLVPTMLARILDHPDFAETDLTALTSIAYGAAAAPIELVQRAMTALPHVAFANVFGQTETLGAYTTLGPADHHDPARVGSVGRPLPGVRVRVVDPDTSADVPEGEVGELWVDSPQNVRPGWLHTGDLARQDADGYLYPAGRMSETINRGGEKFGPIEVAEAVRSHPAVVDAAVAGVPDPELGERVGVAVVTGAASTLTREELRDWCRSKLAPFKLPDLVVFVDALPYNELGKLSRKAASELIIRESKR